VLVGCDMTGGYVTADGGATWRMFNLRGSPRMFAFDPRDARLMYAASVGLFRSRDGGGTWTLVYPAPSSVVRIDRRGDHADEVLLVEGGAAPTVTALAADPSRAGTLFVALDGDGRCSLHVSRDAGQTFSRVVPLSRRARRIFVDPRSPEAARALVVVHDDAVSVFDGGSLIEQPRVAGVSFLDVTGGYGRDDPRFVLYAAVPRAAGSLLVSTDQGTTFVSALGDLAPRASGEVPEIRAVAACAARPEVAYVSFSGLEERGLRRDRSFGVARTNDRGKTWQLVWRESREKARHVDDGWISDRFGPDWGEHPLHLGVAPADPEQCWATDMGRTLKTSDGGASWRAAYCTRSPAGRFSTTGLDVTSVHDLAVDPFDRARMLMSCTDVGLLRSDDGGASWASATSRGVPRKWQNSTYCAVFDPEVKGLVWAGMSNTHDLPRAKMWRKKPPSAFLGGVCVSRDAGLSWSALAGLPEMAVTHLVVDPASPRGRRVLHAAGFGRGVFTSPDGGASWTLHDAGLAHAAPLVWRLTADGAGSLYAVVVRSAEDRGPGGEGDGALFRSVRGGRWERLGLPDGVNGPAGLAVDPRDPKRLALAAWGWSSPRGPIGGGVYLSDDGGASWRPSLTQDAYVSDVTVDARVPGTIYAAGFSSTLWRSRDGGASWGRLRGFDFKWAQRVLLDPDSPASIYVATFGGGLFHGPAAGDASAHDALEPRSVFVP
jgi:hypothetical protein